MLRYRGCRQLLASQVRSRRPGTRHLASVNRSGQARIAEDVPTRDAYDSRIFDPSATGAINREYLTLCRLWSLMTGAGDRRTASFHPDRVPVGRRPPMSDRIDAMSRPVARSLGGVSAVAGDRRSPSKGERQRRAILDSLEGLLARRLIGDLTVGEIADDAGVRRSGFYFYFESKYTALAVLTADIWSELMVRTDSFARATEESTDEWVTRIAETALALWQRNSPVLIAAVQAMPADAQIKKMWLEWNHRVAAVIAEQVVQDRDTRDARPAISDIETLVETLLEMTNHTWYLNSLNRCDQAQTDRTMSAVRAIWLTAVWGAAPPKASRPRTARKK